MKTNKDFLEEFKVEICDKSSEIDPDAERDWFDLSYGFFLARGATVEQAIDLAIEARYKNHYWTNK